MIRLNRDDRLALALALLALILVSGELILRLAGSYTATKTGVPDSVSLVLAGDWTNNADIQALGRMLDDFHSLYPYITVESRMTDARGGPGDAWYADAHVVVRTGPPPAESSPFGEYPVAWTGQLWVLASRRAYLTEAFGRLPEEVERLRSGQAGALPMLKPAIPSAVSVRPTMTCYAGSAMDGSTARLGLKVGPEVWSRWWKDGPPLPSYRLLRLQPCLP